MSQIIAYLLNDNFIDIDIPKPLNTSIYLNENYDIVDEKNNLIYLRKHESIIACEKALKSFHENKKKDLTEKIASLYKHIGELETKSQNVNDKEYINISDEVKNSINDIDKINLKIYELNSLYDEKIKNIRPPSPQIVYDSSPDDPNFVPVSPRRIEPRSPWSPYPLQQVYVDNVPHFIEPRSQYPLRQVYVDNSQPVIYPQPRMVGGSSGAPQNSGFKSSNIVYEMASRVTDVQGWDKDAVETVQNWRYLFKEYKYIYEWILEKNYKISTNLNLISVVSSSMMGCFSAFKLWVQDDRTFQATSDIIMLFSNFLIAAITTSSKRYIDDNRNEKIRNYLEDVNKFLGTISSELIKSPEYRMHADDFIKGQQEIYSKLSTSKPNITISELTAAKNSYRKFENSFTTFSDRKTQTSDFSNDANSDCGTDV